MKLNNSALQLRRTLKQHNFRASLRKAIEKERDALEEEGHKKRLTASEYFALRTQVRADVEAYLLEHGQAGVTEAIVGKWTNDATRSCLRQMVGVILDEPPSPEAIQAARERIAQRLADRPTMRQDEARAQGVQFISAQLPAAPSPAYIAQHGVQKLERLDIFEELNRLYRDTELLRSSSVGIDPKSGRETVKNARTFDKSISRRLEVLATSLASQKELWDLQRMESFYTAIIEVIAGVDPSIAAEIQRRLAAMNIHVGAT